MAVYNEIMTGGGVGGGSYLVPVFSQAFTWSNKGTYLFTRSFQWNDGSQPKKWYRVLGCCRYPTAQGSGAGIPGPSQPGGCEVLPFQSNDGRCTGALGRNQFVQNIVASDLNELCNYMIDTKWTWPICSIQVFSRPADNRFVDPSETCNTLSDVEYCHIPGCMDFCLQTDAVVRMGMTATVVVSFYRYKGSGGVTASGQADYRLIGGGTTGPAWQYVGRGGVQVGGHAPARLAIDTGYSLADMGLHTDVQDLEVLFATQDNNSVALEAEAGFIATSCGDCSHLPLVLNMTHNIGSGSVLSEFCIRNGLSVPAVVPLHWSSRREAWMATLHYSGTSGDNQNYRENWRILFEWTCVNAIAGQPTGAYVWKFGIAVVRSNESTGLSSETRILLAFPPDNVCGDPSFKFGFSVNTQNISVVADNNIVVDSVLLYDNIGLFKSSSWAANPNLKIIIAQGQSSEGFTTQNIFSIFPV